METKSDCADVFVRSRDSKVQCSKYAVALPKIKSNIAADIAVFIILSAIDTRGKLFWTDETARLSFLFGKRSGKKCVLMAEKAAGIDHKTVPVGIESDRLSVCCGIPGGIFDGEMLERYIMCIDKEV